MMGILTFFHIMAAVILVLTVLVQGGKGADLGASFGGASQTVFGSSGGSTFFTKLTAYVAAFFMLSSIGLAYLSAHHSSKSVIPRVIEEPAKVPEAELAPQPAPAAPTENAAPGAPVKP